MDKGLSGITKPWSLNHNVILLAVTSGFDQPISAIMSIGSRKKYV